MYLPNLKSAALLPKSIGCSQTLLDCSFEWELRTPVPKSWERGGRRGSGMVPCERAFVCSYSSLHTNFSCIFYYAFQRYCRFCSPSRHFFPTPPLISLKFPHVSLWLGVGGSLDRLLAAKSEGVGLNVCAICFQDYVITIHQRHRRTDGRHAIARPRLALKCIAR